MGSTGGSTGFGWGLLGSWQAFVSGICNSHPGIISALLQFKEGYLASFSLTILETSWLTSLSDGVLPVWS